VSTNRRKYIESHWLVFAVKGAIALVAGLLLTLSNKTDTNYLAKMVGFAMAGLGVIEVFNTINRKRLQHNWGMSLAIGVVELLVAICMLFTINTGLDEQNNILFRIPMLSFYMLAASVLSIAMGFTCFKDDTDKFMWIVSGIVGAILAFVELGGTGLSDTTHIKLFGTYLMVRGITDMIFGIHSREEVETIEEARKAQKTTNKTTKKTTKKGRK
jgi:uncharacterized membrane protein HdeD (DUF308 family)